MHCKYYVSWRFAIKGISERESVLFETRYNHVQYYSFKQNQGKEEYYFFPRKALYIIPIIYFSTGYFLNT